MCRYLIDRLYSTDQCKIHRSSGLSNHGLFALTSSQNSGLLAVIILSLLFVNPYVSSSFRAPRLTGHSSSTTFLLCPPPPLYSPPFSTLLSAHALWSRRFPVDEGHGRERHASSGSVAAWAGVCRHRACVLGLRAQAAVAVPESLTPAHIQSSRRQRERCEDTLSSSIEYLHTLIPMRPTQRDTASSCLLIHI